MFITTKLSDNLRKGAEEMNEIARFLHNGKFYDDSKMAFDLADEVIELARRIESRLMDYSRAVRETSEEPRSKVTKPRHDLP